MVIGIRLRDFLHLPGLHIKVREREDCISCGKCNQECPMGLDVKKMIQGEYIKSTECIGCGACVDKCPRNILCYGIKAGKGKR